MADTEKAVLLEVDIDTTGAVADLIRMKNELDAAKKAVDDLAVADEDGKKSIDKNSEAYILASTQVKILSDEVRKQENYIKQSTIATSENSNSIDKAKAALSAVTIEWGKEAAVVGENSERAKELAKEKLRLTDILKTEELATGDARRNVGNYTQSIIDAVNQLRDHESAIRKNLLALESIKLATKGNEDEQKKANLEIEANQNALVKVNTELKKYGQNLDITDAQIISSTKIKDKDKTTVKDGSNALLDAAKSNEKLGSAAQTGAKGFEILNMIMKANIIGVIVASIIGLVSWFSKTATGAHVLSEALAVISGVATTIGHVFSDLFSGNWNKLGSDIKNFAKDVSKNVKESLDLEEEERSFKRFNIAIDENVSKLESRAAKLQLAKNDETKGFKEREDAAKQFDNVEQKIFELKEERLSRQSKKKQTELEIAQKNGGSVIDILEEQSKIEIEKAKLEDDNSLRKLNADKETQQRMEKQLEIQFKILEVGFTNTRSINDKIIESDKEAFDNRTKKLEENKVLFQKSLQDESTAIEKVTGKKVNFNEIISISDSEILQKKLLGYGLDEKASQLVTESLKRHRQDLIDLSTKDLNLKKAIALAAVSDMENELKEWQSANKSKIDGAKELNAVVYSKERERIGAEYQEEANLLKAKLDGDIIKQKEYDASLIVLQTKFATDKEKINKTEEKNNEISAKNTLQLEYDLALKGSFAQLNIAKKLNKDKLAEEKKVALARGASLEEQNLITKKYADADIEIEKSKSEIILGAASSLSTSIMGLFKQNTIAYKAAAIAQVAIDTWKGAQGAYNAMVGIPYVGPILAPIAAGIAIAAGLANVAKIVGIDVNGSGGGSGGSDSSGSGGGSIASSPQSSINTPQSTSASIGAGIVTRDSNNIQSKSIVDGVTNAVSNIKLQPTLLTDDVTLAQSRKNTKLNTVAI